MTEAEVMAELRSLGTEQTRKTWTRHGVKGEMFGVRYADLYRIQKKIKVDQELAEKLWKTRNHDARVLATLIGDPSSIKSTTLSEWVKQADNYVIAGGVATFAFKVPGVMKHVPKWMSARSEMVAMTGWTVLAGLTREKTDLTDADWENYLEEIEAKIHTSPNRVRYAMNNALIAIGLINPHLQELALAAAGRIGKVEVDHGDTDCKTPDAAEYIRKAAARKKAKKKTG